MKNALDHFKNPVIQAQTNESPFVADKVIGHTMPHGSDFIGESQFISLQSTIEEIRQTNRKVILNIGDSSTSGWDSGVIALNKKRQQDHKSPIPAFFRYKTYSDYLRKIFNDEYIVINAGVPAHTSLQGLCRLKYLLNIFKQNNITIDCVTIYYGNNDCVWDHNRQDKHWVGKSRAYQQFCHFLTKIFKSTNQIVTRVGLKDYLYYIRAMVKECAAHEINAIVIEPLAPIYWEPGTRVKNEQLPRLSYPGSVKVYGLLDQALELWRKALKIPFSEAKEALLWEAREKDFVVPRIKKEYLADLRRFVSRDNIPYLQVTLDRSVDDIQYFIDYCHPINDANVKIAEGLKQYLLTGDYSTLKSDKASTEGFEQLSAQNNLELPTDHYTLF